MVARISIGKSIRGTLHYNENKVATGEAQLIMASGFAGEIDGMGFNQKLKRFRHLTNLTPNVKTNTVHISLNFHSSEELDNRKLQGIAGNYMAKIGFGDQPFLVYRHNDAAHTHVHIVTTNISATQGRIDLHDIGKLKSEPARKAIEEEFNLVRAESKQFKQDSGIRAADLTKAKYGQIPTKRATSNVITAVVRDYRFTSLAELNAVLKCFNVIALRGGERTPMYEKKGLMFSLLSREGIAIGVPIKASSFYTKPTLRNLEKKFDGNREKRRTYRQDLKQRIDQVLEAYAGLTAMRLEKELKDRAIDIVFRTNDEGQVFGVTFVDHWNKVVFNGSDLGKTYSAKAITGRFAAVTKQVKAETMKQVRPALRNVQQPAFHFPNDTAQLVNPLEILLGRTEQDYSTGIPRRRKRRKKRGQTGSQELTL
jgi:hypothetical protein